MAGVSNKIIIEVWQRQEGVCAMCGDPLDESAWENHHMHRVKDGGSDSPDNIVLLCDRDEHLYTHAGDFRKPVQTMPENYPYFYGKSGYRADDRQDFGIIEIIDSSTAEEQQIEAELEAPEEVDEAKQMDTSTGTSSESNDYYSGYSY